VCICEEFTKTAGALCIPKLELARYCCRGYPANSARLAPCCAADSAAGACDTAPSHLLLPAVLVRIVAPATTLMLTLSSGFGTPQQQDQEVVLRLSGAGQEVTVGTFDVAAP
jgi:hypothetical protein